MDEIITTSIKQWPDEIVLAHKNRGRIYPVSYRYVGMAFQKAANLRESGVECYVIAKSISGPWYIHIGGKQS